MAVEREPLMTVTEVARGLHVGLMTVRRMIHRHELRAARIGKQWRIPVAEFERLATPPPIAANTGSAEPVQAASYVNSQGHGVGTGTNGLEEGFRFLRNRPWETADHNDERPAARRRAQGKRKTALSAN